MSLQNDLLWTHALVVHDERNGRITIRIKPGLISSNPVAGAITTIIEKQNIESVFRKPLAHPAHTRDVAAVAVTEDDGRGRRFRLTFKEPAVQTRPISRIEPNDLRSFGRHFALLRCHTGGTKRHQRLQPAQSVHEARAAQNK